MGFGILRVDFQGSIYVMHTLPGAALLYQGGPQLELRLGQIGTYLQGFIEVGSSVTEALSAHSQLKADNIEATVVNCRFIKPLDTELIGNLAKRIQKVITVEENVLHGGFGSAVLESLNSQDIVNVRIKRVGIADIFVEHGPQRQLRSVYGVDASAIVQAAKQLFDESTR